MAFADLLHAAAFVHFHALDGKGVVEVRDVRVVEGDVAVLAEAKEGDVDGSGGQKRGIAPAFLPGVGTAVRSEATGTGPEVTT